MADLLRVDAQVTTPSVNLQTGEEAMLVEHVSAEKSSAAPQSSSANPAANRMKTPLRNLCQPHPSLTWQDYHPGQ